MYINDVIRQVRSYYPSEYDTDEMYIWCDEVSSMLIVEDRHTYRRMTLPVSDDGSFLLPEGVDMENIVYVISGGTVVNKEDMREYGNRKFYVKGLNGKVVYNPVRRPVSVEVDYLVPYQPIRRVRYHGGVTLDKENSELRIDVCEFIAGDTVRLTMGDETIEQLPVLGIRYDDGYILSVPLGSLDLMTETKSDQGLIVRIVTDLTVCPPPFDSMYTDYILAKINMYQRDMESYNQFMTAFNSRLAAYKRWIISRMPKGEGRFKNWW